MYEFSVGMALADFIPVMLFALAAVYMLKDLYHAMTRGVYAAFAAGIADVFTAGFLKALWKLLYACGACDFHALNTLFLPLQSLGFLLCGIALLTAVSRNRKALRAAAPPLFGGTVMFLAMMVLGLGALCAGLGTIAARLRKKGALVLFALCFAFSMGMGFVGRLDSSLAWVNWLEQGINSVSQLCLALGVLTLHKNGLERI